MPILGQPPRPTPEINKNIWKKRKFKDRLLSISEEYKESGSG
jgi:hypothetical protein